MNIADENDADDAIYRLEGTSGEQRGGLVIMKKGQSADVDRHEFKRPAPKQSLLGLDKLAASKRLQAVEPDTAEKVKNTQRERLVCERLHVTDYCYFVLSHYWQSDLPSDPPEAFEYKTRMSHYPSQNTRKS